MILEKKYDLLKKRTARQSEEISSLYEKIYDLEIENKKKQDLINSLDSINKEWKNSLDDINKQKEEYKKLILELKEMKKVMKSYVFNNKWKLIKFLTK